MAFSAKCGRCGKSWESESPLIPSVCFDCAMRGDDRADSPLPVMLIQPGDVLLVQSEQPLTTEQAEDMSRRLAAKFPNHKSLVVSGVKLSILRGVT